MTYLAAELQSKQAKMSRKRALVAVLIWPIIASVLSFAFSADILTSIFLFFGVPAVYLSYLCRMRIVKTAFFSVLVTLPIATVVDYVMEHTGGWFLPLSVFGDFRLFGYVTIEQYIWLFLYVYLVVMFYETFLEHAPTRERTLDPRLKWLSLLLLVPLGVFLILLAVNHSWLQIDYFYLKFGLIMVIPPIIFLVFRLPKLLGRMLKAGTYFFFLSFIYELTALALGQWEFPAENQFIGILDIGGMRFPFEEFFFWILLGAIATLSYYEFFDDDRR